MCRVGRRPRKGCSRRVAVAAPPRTCAQRGCFVRRACDDALSYARPRQAATIEGERAVGVSLAPGVTAGVRATVGRGAGVVWSGRVASGVRGTGRGAVWGRGRGRCVRGGVRVRSGAGRAWSRAACPWRGGARRAGARGGRGRGRGVVERAGRRWRAGRGVVPVGASAGGGRAWTVAGGAGVVPGGASGGRAGDGPRARRGRDVVGASAGARATAGRAGGALSAGVRATVGRDAAPGGDDVSRGAGDGRAG